jgi:hypothetical protein
MASRCWPTARTIRSAGLSEGLLLMHLGMSGGVGANLPAYDHLTW